MGLPRTRRQKEVETATDGVREKDRVSEVEGCTPFGDRWTRSVGPRPAN